MLMRHAATVFVATSGFVLGCSSSPCKTAVHPDVSVDADPFFTIGYRPPGVKEAVPWMPMPGPLQKEFDAAHPVLAPSQCEGLKDMMGITEVSIEQDGCKGQCIAYTLHLYADGRAEFDWRKQPNDREFTKGKIDQAGFARVAQLAVEMGYFDLDDYYSCGSTYRGGTTFTSIVRNGTRKIVAHPSFADSGPFRLRALEDAIEELARHASWIKGG
jgi:hypothetical protein